MASSPTGSPLPEAAPGPRRPSMGWLWFNWWALVIIAIGIAWALEVAGVFQFSSEYVAPAVLIVVGIAFLLGGFRRRMWMERRMARHASRFHDPACTCSCECCARARSGPPFAGPPWMM